jgi:hypothetical protein
MFIKYFNNIIIIYIVDTSTDWKRSEKDIQKRAEKRKKILKRGLYLLRYKIDAKVVKELEDFRDDPNHKDVTFFGLDTVLGAKVQLRVSRDAVSHFKQTNEYIAAGKRFYRSSTISTNQHIFVTPIDSS